MGDGLTDGLTDGSDGKRMFSRPSSLSISPSKSSSRPWGTEAEVVIEGLLGGARATSGGLVHSIGVLAEDA